MWEMGAIKAELNRTFIFSQSRYDLQIDNSTKPARWVYVRALVTLLLKDNMPPN